MPFGLRFRQSAHQPALPAEASGETNLAAPFGQDGLETADGNKAGPAQGNLECLGATCGHRLHFRLCAQFQRLMLSSLQEDLGPSAAHKKIRFQETRMDARAHTHTCWFQPIEVRKDLRGSIGNESHCYHASKASMREMCISVGSKFRTSDVASRLSDISSRAIMICCGIHPSIRNILARALSIASFLRHR